MRAVEKPEEAWRFAGMDRWLEKPEQYPPHVVGIPLDAELISKLLSRNRVDLLRTVRTEGPFESVEVLAEALGRNYTSVSRDLTHMAESGLVELEQHGHRKRVRATDAVIIIG